MGEVRLCGTCKHYVVPSDSFPCSDCAGLPTGNSSRPLWESGGEMETRRNMTGHRSPAPSECARSAVPGDAILNAVTDQCWAC